MYFPNVCEQAVLRSWVHYIRVSVSLESSFYHRLLSTFIYFVFIPRTVHVLHHYRRSHPLTKLASVDFRKMEWDHAVRQGLPTW